LQFLIIPVLRRLTIRECRRLPSGIFGVESAANVNRVYSEAIENEVLRLRELLYDIVNASVALINSQMFLEIAVCDGRNPRTGCRAKVHGHTVWFAVFDGGEDKFA